MMLDAFCWKSGQDTRFARWQDNNRQNRPAFLIPSLIPTTRRLTISSCAKRYSQLWVAGLEIDWSRWRGSARRQRLSLPTYPFEHQQYWIEPGAGHSAQDADSGDVGERLELDDWFSRPVWKRIDLDETLDEQEQPQEWLIFLDAAGVGLSLTKRLRAAGHRVATVREGDAFYRFSEDEFAMTPENGREHYDMCWTELIASKRLPTRVAHLWLLTKTTGSSFFHRNQERGFYSLMFLAQSLADLEQPPTIRMAVISNGMQAVGTERLAYADKATVWAPFVSFRTNCQASSAAASM